MDSKPTAFEMSKKNQTTSADRWFGKSVIYGKEDEHATPYMTRYWIGRLRLHIFHRGDQDPDCHDHPWDFWTFPFHSYVEEVVDRHEQTFNHGSGAIIHPPIVTYEKRRQVVPAFKLSFRTATHTHRVLGRYSGYAWCKDTRTTLKGIAPWVANYDPFLKPCTHYGKPIVTLVWRSRDKRKWGFLKNREGKWCWTPWKEYVFGGGKNAPCQ